MRRQPVQAVTATTGHPVWDLEEAFWAATASGEIAAFFANHVSPDAVIVVPGHRLHRGDLLADMLDRGPLWSSYTLSERCTMFQNDQSVVVTYYVEAHSFHEGPSYRAQVCSVYAAVGEDWETLLRQHTPDPDVVVDKWLPKNI